MDITILPQIIHNEGVFCNSIKESEYIQKVEDIDIKQCESKQCESKQCESNSTLQEKELKDLRYNDIVDCIIANNESMYHILPSNDRHTFCKQKRIELASKIDEDKILFNSYNFNTKFMKQNKIQQGLQVKNHVSSIYYLNEYYKKHHIIVSRKDNCYYKTTVKDYEKIYLVYEHNKCVRIDTIESGVEERNLYGLSGFFQDIIINDVVVKDNLLIYNLYLQSLSKYKLSDLQLEAQKVGIKITNEKGKAKLKNDLYREINIKKL